MQKIQDGRHLVQSKVSFAGYVKKESVALFPGQLKAKFPWKEANTQFFTFFFLTCTHIEKKMKKIFFQKKIWVEGGWGGRSYMKMMLNAPLNP